MQSSSQFDGLCLDHRLRAFVSDAARRRPAICQGPRAARQGIWFRCLRGCGIRPRKFYSTRHTFIAWALSEGANLKGLAEYCGTSVQMIEQSYGRFMRKDFLGPLIGARPETLREAAVGGNTGPLTGPPKGVSEKRPEFPRELWWRRGELKIRSRESPVRKSRNSGGFSACDQLQYTTLYRELSLRDSKRQIPDSPYSRLCECRT